MVAFFRLLMRKRRGAQQLLGARLFDGFGCRLAYGAPHEAVNQAVRIHKESCYDSTGIDCDLGAWLPNQAGRNVTIAPFGARTKP